MTSLNKNTKLILFESSEVFAYIPVSSLDWYNIATIFLLLKDGQPFPFWYIENDKIYKGSINKSNDSISIELKIRLG